MVGITISYLLHNPIRLLFDGYHGEFWYLISGFVAFVCMGILVWFADMLTGITYNLFLVWMLIHRAYLLIRMMVTSSKGSRY